MTQDSSSYFLLAGSVLAVAIGGCAVEEGPSSPEAPAPAPSAERFAPGVVSTDGFELGAALSPDGETLYFASIGDGFQTSVIQSSTWSAGGWSKPSPVAVPGVNTPMREFAPSLSPDGKYLFFTRDQRDPEAGPVRLGDIYRIDAGILGGRCRSGVPSP